MQRIIFTGNLTADPEIRSTPSGVTVCSFTVAVNRRFANADGDRITDFFRVNAWRQLGESCGKYLAKGRKVAVVGELQARTYQAKDGTTRMSLDVAADEVEFLSPKESDSATVQNGNITPDKPQNDGFTDISSDDLPF
jgi:single-strand DNA-binding protein